MKKKQTSEHTLDKSKTVVNLSQRPLTSSEEDILLLGLNYAVAPSKLPITDIIAATETTARHLDLNTAQKPREGVSRVLTAAKLPKPNLTRSQQMALRQLRNDKSIVILRADKGNATVIADRSIYNKKINEVVKDEKTYKHISRNPTTRIENRYQEL